MLHTGCEDWITLEQSDQIRQATDRNGHLLWLFHTLKTTRPMAMMMPTLDMTHMQMKSGKDTVRNTFLMIVLS